MVDGSIALAKRTFMLFRVREGSGTRTGPPIGTAFGVVKPGLVITAGHVVHGMDSRSLMVVCTYCSPIECIMVDKMERHPVADVAALFLRKGSDLDQLEYFSIGRPSDVYSGYDEFPLAEDILAYGFPMVGAEKPVRPRMMKGHIQAKYEHTNATYRYGAYELSFPAFPGLSGSPVFCDWDNRASAAIGIVTDRISYSTEHNNQVTKSYLTVAAALHPIIDWIESL